MAAASSSFTPFAVVIKNHYQPVYSLRLVISSPDLTIGKLKTQIEQQHKGNPQIQDQLLVYRGKLLDSKINLFTLFQSSIIPSRPSSPQSSPVSSSNIPKPMPSMYIHMTLRGGSETATKIGLTKSDTPPTPPITEQKSQNSNPTQPITEEKKSNSTQKQFQPRHGIPPLPPHMHMPPPNYSHYPPNPYYFSQSMPNLYAPQYLHRAQSAPTANANPSQPMAPPTLVQQTSNPNQNNHGTLHPMYGYGPVPTPPPTPYGHMPPPYGYQGYGYGYPYHPMHNPPPIPPPPGFGARSHSVSDLRFMRQSSNNKPPAIPSKIDENKEEKSENESDNNGGNNNNNNRAHGRYGLRNRRVPNANAANNNANANVVNNEANNNGNNNANANANAAVNEGWFQWFFRVLNINVLIRLGIFMWLFGPNLGTYRFTMLCIAGGFYYLFQIGILQRIIARFRRNGNRNANANANEPRHRDPNADNANGSDENNDRQPLIPLSYVQLLQRFLIGIFSSLWPTWDHRNVYPANLQ